MAESPRLWHSKPKNRSVFVNWRKQRHQRSLSCYSRPRRTMRNLNGFKPREGQAKRGRMENPVQVNAQETKVQFPQEALR